MKKLLVLLMLLIVIINLFGKNMVDDKKNWLVQPRKFVP